MGPERTPPSRATRLGRPLLQSPEALLARIRELAGRGELQSVHRAHPGLYARARRQFGSWARAVTAVGLDAAELRRESVRRSVARRGSRRTTRPNTHSPVPDPRRST